MKDNLTLGGGDGLYETAFVPSGAKPVKMRFYGPIKRGAGYASWTEAFVVQCRQLGSEDQCNWVTLENAFVFEGPESTTTDVTALRTISMGRAAGVAVRPGIYRVIPKVHSGTGAINSVLCADEVAGNPPTVWPTACGESPDGFHDPAFAYVVRVIPDCDGDTVDDEDQDPAPDCSTNCHLADVNGTGTITVQDIFDFLTFYFANDLRADMNGTGTVTVQDIFDFLGLYFGCN